MRESVRSGGAGIPSTWLNMAAFIQRTQQEGEKGELSAHTARSGGRGLTQHAKGR